MKNKLLIVLTIFLITGLIPFITVGQELKKGSIDNIQIEWLVALNNSVSLESFYIDNSGILLDNTMYIGLEEISKQLRYLVKNAGMFNSYKKLDSHQLQDNEIFILGEYRTSNGFVLSSIIGWKKGDRWTKEFEVIYKNVDDFTLEIDSIIHGRKKWEQLANRHRPDLIVDEVFSKNGKYFHRGTLYKNREIIKAYSYMSNDSYMITLEPLKVQQVNSNVIYEIGVYRAGGKGLYTLIWVKEIDTWKLLLDFNF